MNDAKHIAALEDLRLGVEMDRHNLPDGEAKLVALDHAIAALKLRAVAEPSAEEAAALYRASMTETKGGFTEAIHHFARVLLSRYGAHKPDGGDAKDAERYRILRRHTAPLRLAESMGIPRNQVKRSDDPAAHVDEMCDAAIAQQRKEG